MSESAVRHLSECEFRHFSVVNALLLRAAAVSRDRLAVLRPRSPGINIPQDWPSPGQFIDIQTENEDGFSSVQRASHWKSGGCR
jgi:hypothetical protein